MSYTEGPSGKSYHSVPVAFYAEWYYLNDTSSAGCGHECSDDISFGVSEEKDQASPHIVSTVLEMLLILVTVIGNALVLLNVAVKRNVNGLHTWFLVTFSLGDFLVGAFVLPLMLANSLAGYWYLGRFLCHVWVSADAVLCTLSSFVLCLSVLDRYVSIVKGSTYLRNRTIKCTALITSVVWVLSLVISSLEYFERQMKASEYSPCVQSEYAVYRSAGLFYILLSATIVTYLCIFFTVRAEVKKKWKALLNVDDTETVRSRFKGRRPHLDRDEGLLEVSEANSGSEKEDLITSSEKCIMKQNKVASRFSQDYANTDLLLQEFNTSQLNQDVEIESQESDAADLRNINVESDNEDVTSRGYSKDVKKRWFLSQYDMHSHHTQAVQLSVLKTRSCPELKINCRGSLQENPTHNLGSNDGSAESTRAPWSREPGRPDATSSVEFHWNTHYEKVRLRERRSVVILGVILAAFVACRAPYLSVHVLVARTGIKLNEVLWTTLFWIGHANSALNPLIYAIFHRCFRRV